MLSIVLSRRDFREFDQLISVYTKESGKIELLARGVKKMVSKNSAFLEPIFLIDLDFVPGRELSHLTKVVPQVCFDNILLDLNKISLLKYAWQVFNSAVGLGERDPLLFNLLVSWLNFLQTSDEVNLNMADVFLIRLWQILGFKPQLDRCVSCGSKEVKCFSAKSGGVLCASCSMNKNDEKIFAINLENLDLLKMMSEEPLAKISQKLSKLDTRVVHNIIFSFISFHSHQPIVELK